MQPRVTLCQPSTLNSAAMAILHLETYANHPPRYIFGSVPAKLNIRTSVWTAGNHYFNHHIVAPCAPDLILSYLMYLFSSHLLLRWHFNICCRYRAVYIDMNKLYIMFFISQDDLLTIDMHQIVMFFILQEDLLAIGMRHLRYTITHLMLDKSMHIPMLISQSLMMWW